MGMTNIANAANVNEQDEEQKDFVDTPKTPVKIQMWTTDGNIVKADIIGQWATEIDGKSISEHMATESPIEKRVDADDNLVLSLNRNAQSFQVDYGITEFSAIYSNRDKNIWFRPDPDSAIQSCISVSITADYAKFECLIDNRYFICQVDSADNWSKTQLDTSSVLVCDVHSTTYQEAFDASYCYVKDDEGIIFGLTEKTNRYIRFTNVDNDMRHIWTVNTDNEWFLTDEDLCPTKQDKLTAGTNITIEDNVISAKGGDAWTYTDESLTTNASFRQYVDRTFTGWVDTVAINVETDASIGIIRIKNNIDTPIHVSLYNMTRYTLFGTGNKTSYGYMLDIPGNGMLVAKIDHLALYTSLSKYSSGSTTPTVSQDYDTDGNPIDTMLALHTSMFASLDKGFCIELLDKMINGIKTFFVSVYDKGHNDTQTDTLSGLTTTFAAVYTA